MSKKFPENHSVTNFMACMTWPPNISSLPQGAPKRIAVALFPQYELLDWIGPIEALTELARNLQHPHEMKLYLLSHDTNEHVSSGPFKRRSDGKYTTPGGLDFVVNVVSDAKYTYKNPPPALEVLIIPGGYGTGGASNKLEDIKPALEVVEFLKTHFKSLRYLITVCTGAGLAARAGVLDGLYATTNKALWTDITPLGPETYWIADARWVESSEKIWTTSGVSAGTDGALAWMAKVYGEAVANWAAIGMEWNRQFDPWNDQFARIDKVTDVAPKKTLPESSHD